MGNPDGNAPMRDVGSYDTSGRLRVAVTGEGTQTVTLDGEKVVLDAGSEHIGQVGGPGDTIVVNPTVTAGVYAANDVVGGLLEFPNAARAAGLGGYVFGVIIVDDAGQDSEMELWLFDTEPTGIADNAAFAPAEDDLHNQVGVLSTVGETWRSAGTPSSIDIDKVKRFDCSGTSLWGFLVDRTGGTLAATDDITISLKVGQD